MTVRIYHNHDTDAPVLSNTAGSMIAVLEAVLVTGYGDKQPLGWTKEFHVGDVAVFRNDPTIPGSTGMYLRVDDTYTNYAACQVYKTMSDIGTGTDVAPNITILNRNEYIFWFKHYTGAVSPKRWTLVGDERTFYLMIDGDGAYPTNNSRYTTLAGAGDFISFVPGNEWNYFISGKGEANVSTAYTWPSTAGATSRYSFYIGRAQDLIAGKPAVAETMCAYNNAPGNTSHLGISAYTGLQHFAPAYFISHDTSDGASISGELRGCIFYIGRALPEWFPNFGQIEGPNGPTFYEMGAWSNGLGNPYGSIVIKDDGWD